METETGLTAAEHAELGRLLTKWRDSAIPLGGEVPFKPPYYVVPAAVAWVRAERALEMLGGKTAKDEERQRRMELEVAVDAYVAYITRLEP